MQEFLPSKTEEILKSHAAIVQNALVDLGGFSVRPRRPVEAWHCFDDLTELVFAFPQGLLGLSSIINIDQDTIPTQYCSIASSQGFSAYIEPSVSAVRSSNSADRIVMISGFENLEPSTHFERDVVWMDLFHPAPANDFAKWRSNIFEHTLVHVLEIAAWPSSPHQCRNGLHQQ